MSLVLAVEPDGPQAQVLGGLIGGQAGTELVVVTSASAAIVKINRRVPDLVLLGASLGPTSQDVVDRLRSVSGAPSVQTLRIPPLRTTDPETFAAEVAVCLARAADEQRRHQVDAAAPGIDPGGAGSTQEEEVLLDREPLASDALPIAAEVHYAHIAFVQADAEARLASELERVRREAAEQRAAELADIRSQAEQCLAAELGRARAEAAQRLAEQIEEADALRSAAVEQARLDAEQAARQLLDAEVARIKTDTDERLAAEVARARQESDAEREAMARELARLAAAEAVSAEVARAEITIPMAAARVLAHADSHTASATIRAAGIAFRLLGRCRRAALPVLRDVWERRPAHALPAVAIVLLVVGGVAFGGVSWFTATVTSSARSASGTAATLFGRAAKAVQGVLASNQAPDPTRPPAQAAVDPEQEPTTPAEPAGAGMLAVFSRVPLDLYVSGRRIGTTDDGQILVPSGRYRVELVSTRLNYRGEVTLDVRPAAVTAHTVSLPNGRLLVNTETGAEVWIEGERAGVAPLGVVPVPIGTREIVVRHPDLGERREFVELRYGDVTEISIARRESLDPRKAYPLPSLEQPGAPTR